MTKGKGVEQKTLVIKRRAELDITKELSKYVKDCEHSVLHDDKADPDRFYFLRPSAFPFCGLKKWLESADGEFLEPDRVMTFGSDYFTGVGHTVHHVFQRYLGKGGRLIGDWKCKCRVVDEKTKANRPKILRFCAYKPCKVCNNRQYEELEVKYKDTVIGHVDTLYKDKRGRYWVVDYKTTSSSKVVKHRQDTKARRPSKFPYPGNVFQISSYVPLLEHQYGIKIEGWILYYISRDNPFHSFVMIPRAMTEEQKEERLAEIDRDLKVHRRMLKADTEEKMQVLVKHRLCKSKKDYEQHYADEYNPCPYLDKCFSKKGIEPSINKALRIGAEHTPVIYPLLRHAPADVRARLGLTLKETK